MDILAKWSYIIKTILQEHLWVLLKTSVFSLELQSMISIFYSISRRTPPVLVLVKDKKSNWLLPQ